MIDITLDIIHAPATEYDRDTSYCAVILINGTKSGMAINDGTGNRTRIKVENPEGLVLLKKAEEYCGSIPRFGHEHNPGKQTYTYRLDEYCDEIIFQNTKIGKIEDLKKETATALVYGKQADGYKVLQFNAPIKDLLNTRFGTLEIKDALSKIRWDLQAGEVVFNKNIPAALLSELPVVVAQKFKKDHSVKPPGDQKNGKHP